MARYPELMMYIAGSWKTADGEPVLNPADESVIGTIPHATKADLDAALSAAQGGLRVWSKTSPAKRAEVILAAARIMCEEPFGPLALINHVKSLDEAIEKANALPYGLAAYAFTNSASVAERLAEGIEAGNLSINHLTASIAETPFGGVKESGYGREGGTEGREC